MLEVVAERSEILHQLQTDVNNTLFAGTANHVIPTGKRSLGLSQNV
jgi:hypothetical protein